MILSKTKLLDYNLNCRAWNPRANSFSLLQTRLPCPMYLNFLLVKTKWVSNSITYIAQMRPPPYLFTLKQPLLVYFRMGLITGSLHQLTFKINRLVKRVSFLSPHIQASNKGKHPSYGGVLGAPGGTRTLSLLIRSQAQIC